MKYYFIVNLWMKKTAVMIALIREEFQLCHDENV